MKLKTVKLKTVKLNEDREVEVDDGSVGTVGLITKPKTSSAVWNFFGVKSNSSGNPSVGEVEKPVCKLWEKVVPAKGSNTPNLFKHLETSHPKAYSEAWKATRVENKRYKTVNNRRDNR